MSEVKAESKRPPEVESPAAPRAKRRKKSWVRDYGEALLFAVILTLFIRTFVIQAFRIPTGSMEDTLLVGDFLFVNKFLYGAKVPFTDLRLPDIREPKRGDIIVFKYPKDPSKDYIKRVIGLPGDTIEVENKVVHVNGEPIEEDYTKFTSLRSVSPGYQEPGITPRGAGNRDYYGPVTVPEGHYFMMGDNRDNSQDSRAWGFLPEDYIKGKAMFIYFSWGENNMPRFSRIGRLIR